MENLKKNLALGLLLTCAIMVVGCGKKDPTPEELLSQKYDESYVDMDLEMDVVAKMDMSDLMGDDSGSSATMDMEMEIDVNAKSDDSVSYLDGTILVNVFGMNMEVPMKTYTSVSEDAVITYALGEDGETWTKEESALDEAGLSSLTSLYKISDVDFFESYEMKEVEKDDETYVVTGFCSFEKLMEKFGDAEDLLETEMITEEYDMSTMKMNVTMEFDRETLKPVCYLFELDGDSIEMEGASFETFIIKMTINELGGEKVVEIPQEIIDNAIVEEEYSFDEIALEDIAE